MHDPPQHAVPGPHAPVAPHMHVPALQVSPAAHAGSHGGSSQTRLLQSWPDAQCMPQPPHASGSVRKSRHCPSQQISVPLQASPAPHLHAPSMQTLPRPVQSLPHSPQSVSELAVLTHAPLQHVRPPSQPVSDVQPATHVVPRHTVPDGQVIGQPLPPSGAGVLASTPGCDASTPWLEPESGVPAPPCAHPITQEQAINEAKKRM